MPTPIPPLLVSIRLPVRGAVVEPQMHDATRRAWRRGASEQISTPVSGYMILAARRNQAIRQATAIACASGTAAAAAAAVSR